MFNNLNFRLSTSMAHNVSSRGSEKFKQVLGASRGRPIFTATNIRQDPVSKKVLRIVDWRDPTHYLEQTDSTKQCAMPIGHTDFAGQLCLNFIRANATQYVSNRAASYWAIGHNGTGATSVCVSTSTSNTGSQAKYATRPTAGIGLSHYRTTGGATCHYVENAAAQVVVNVASGGVVANDVPTYSDVTYFAPNYAVRVKGTITASGTQSNAPTANAPGSSLILGSDTLNHADMRWPALLWFSPPDSAGRALIQQYIQHTYGIYSI